MKTNRIFITVLSAFVLLFLTGCTPLAKLSKLSFPKSPERLKFYGIEISSELYDNAYVRKEGMKYSYSPLKMNPKVYAQGSLNSYGDQFEISVSNASKKPLRSNYFMDKFTLYTKDNKQYMLKSDNIVNYPKEYINPDDGAWFYVDKPRGLKGERNILKIIVKLADGTRIVLKPELKKVVKKVVK